MHLKPALGTCPIAPLKLSADELASLPPEVVAELSRDAKAQALTKPVVPVTPSPTIWQPTRQERMEQALQALTQPIPGTKGLGPKDRAERLHAELERRIQIAKDAIR
jgi:hypothetical protein